MAQTEQYDVVVAGGGSAGVAAAIGAARTGARTALVESAGCLGGASTIRGVLTYCGLYMLGHETRQAVCGVAQAHLVKLQKLGAVTPPLRHRGVSSCSIRKRSSCRWMSSALKRAWRFCSMAS